MATDGGYDLIAHLDRQIAFSERAFGPQQRAAGVIDHIRKELAEIEADPSDIEEWIDVILLAFDGVRRQGYTPRQIVDALDAKLTRNESREWPDWRTADPDKAIEHVRDSDPAAEPPKESKARRVAVELHKRLVFQGRSLPRAIQEVKEMFEGGDRE